MTRNGKDLVVLVHGLGRTGWSWILAERRLRADGFRTVRVTHPSRSVSIAGLADHVRRELPVDSGGAVHFLAHSLGGLVVRYLMREARPPDLGRVVMLATPNQGSQVARSLRKNPLFRATTGPAGQQLAMDSEELQRLLGPVDFDLGVIVGNRSIDLTSRLIRGDNDGKVAVDEARVDGMADFMVVPRGHTFIMNDPEVLRQAAFFFRNGRFRRQSDDQERPKEG